MTELQFAEFEILREFIDICESLNLKYYLVCGTALGAVKYHGFIPWDDDVDVAMERDDYEKFIQKAQALLPEYLFLQNYHTENPCPRIFTKLRDSRTTYIEKTIASLDVHHGVYIDIFPLDDYPKDRISQIILESKKSIYKRQIATVYAEPRKGFSELNRRINLLHSFDKKTNECVKKMESAIVVPADEGNGMLCNHGNWQGKLEYAPREQYGDGAWAEFEGLKVRIPENYDAYLTQKYGDWRTDLPTEQQVGHHYAEVVDLKRPYTDYVEHIQNGKILVKTIEKQTSI